MNGKEARAFIIIALIVFSPFILLMWGVAHAEKPVCKDGYILIATRYGTACVIGYFP